MALFPCDFDGKRYPGAQQTIYPAVVDGVDTWRRKLRLCPTHFDYLLSFLDANANNAQLEVEDVDLALCVECRKPVADSTLQFFATAYAKGTERADRWSCLHQGCAQDARDRWRL